MVSAASGGPFRPHHAKALKQADGCQNDFPIISPIAPPENNISQKSLRHSITKTRRETPLASTKQNLREGLSPGLKSNVSDRDNTASEA
jgi:hypothetical protein